LRRKQRIKVMAQVQIDDTVTREFGKAGSFEINLAAMPEASLAYIFAYGLKQVLTDAHSAAKTPDEAKGMTGKKLDALMRGEFRVSSGRTSDPVRAEAKRLARVAILAGLKARGMKAEAKAIAEGVDKIADRYMDEARKNVEAAGKVAEGLDLTALGF